MALPTPLPDPVPWVALAGAALLGVVAVAAWPRRGSGLDALGEGAQGLRLVFTDGPWLVSEEHAIRLEYLGAGGFAKVYREVGGAGRVFSIVPGYVRDKDAAADAYAAVGAKNPHLPAVRRFGRTVDGQRVYVMPYYEVSSFVEGPAGEASAALEECDVHVGRAMNLDPGDVEGQQDAILACAERRGVAPAVVDALVELAASGAKYSDEFRFDFQPTNFGVDAEGNLVLLDVLWDAKASRRKMGAESL